VFDIGGAFTHDWNFHCPKPEHVERPVSRLTRLSVCRIAVTENIAESYTLIPKNISPSLFNGLVIFIGIKG
jgi:hypothetical protein